MNYKLVSMCYMEIRMKVREKLIKLLLGIFINTKLLFPFFFTVRLFLCDPYTQVIKYYGLISHKTKFKPNYHLIKLKT